jgi:hypothetical protein
VYVRAFADFLVYSIADGTSKEHSLLFWVIFGIFGENTTTLFGSSLNSSTNGGKMDEL